MAPAVGPASVVTVIVVAVVCVRAVVAARGGVILVLTTTTRAEGDACDHQYNHHDRNYKERFH
jgi:hypothetical protein